MRQRFLVLQWCRSERQAGYVLDYTYLTKGRLGREVTRTFKAPVMLFGVRKMLVEAEGVYKETIAAFTVWFVFVLGIFRLFDHLARFIGAGRVVVCVARRVHVLSYQAK